MHLKDISKEHFEWLKEMKWVGKKTPLEALMLIVSEVGEAANECRGEKPSNKLGSELADVILRTMGFAEEMGLDIENEIVKKIFANRLTGTKGRIK